MKRSNLTLVSPREEVVATIEPLLRRLSPDLLARGLRTFDINGERVSVGYDDCFVAMCYGEPYELALEWHNNSVSIFDLELKVSERYPSLRAEEWVVLSDAHYFHPTVMHAVASSILKEA